MKAYKVLCLFILSILIAVSVFGCRKDDGMIDKSPKVTVSPRDTDEMSPDLSPDLSPDMSPDMSPGTSPGNNMSPGADTSPGANGASKQV